MTQFNLDQTHEDHIHDEHCGCGCDCGCDGHHDHETLDDMDIESARITMVDQETGEEYSFIMADEFEHNDQVYCLLLTDEEEPGAVFVRVIEDEEGTETFMTLEDEEFDEVADAYDRLCEEEMSELDSEDETDA